MIMRTAGEPRLILGLGRPIKVEKMPVTPRNRMEFLQHGAIGLLIATMGDTSERRKIIDIVDPDYYASGVTLLTIKANHVTKWEDLKGKWVCTLEGWSSGLPAGSRRHRELARPARTRGR